MFSDFMQEQSRQTNSHMGEATSEKTERNANFKIFKLLRHEFVIRELWNLNVPPPAEPVASRKFKLFGYEFTNSDKTVIERPGKTIEEDRIVSFKREIDLNLELVKTNDKEDGQISEQYYFPEEKPLKKLNLFGSELMLSDFIDLEQNHHDDMDEHHGILSFQEKPNLMGKSVLLDEEGDDQILGQDQETGSKRKLVKSDYDEERDYEKKKPFKKRRKNYSKGSRSGTKNTEKSEPAELPERFKNRISEIGGTETTILIQKSLEKTDVSRGHNRLLIPWKQMKNPDFLLETELQQLKTKGSITVPVMWPSLEIKNIVLTKWNMSKSVYVLRKYWNDVVKAHELKAKDEVQVWSFRVKGQLNLAFVKVI